MLTYIKKYTGLVLITLAVFSQITACNKIPEVEEIDTTPPPGATIADIINTDADYSLLKLAASKAGMLEALGNPKATLTLFAPDNDAFALSGISEGVINALPAEQLAAILSYHVIPQKIPSTAIPETFPNVEMPTLLQLPGAPAIVKMNTFPSRRGTSAFVNNIPIKQADIAASNGVIHNVFALVAPPQKVLLQDIAAEPDLTYLVAAITRADLGMPEGSKFSQLLANPVANFTVFAPNDNAFKAALSFLGFPSNDISMIQLIPVETLIGLVAYHVHIADFAPPSTITFSRAFSVNFPATPGPVKSFLNVVNYPNPTPPLVIAATASVSGGAAVKGYVNPTFSNIVAADKHSVNGVYHKIDQVLLPFMP
ncbi:fasciclin domain-containing protein [Flavihumibacter fluvii]|uniref:fasciclin domain-containing protein n=1 Tax=Flavihumibacter fluvii TaxID=2838157 RepID=UPI001BDE19A1|nr:fasciclin domain-containing protein [Flavihumibacter fluvii]ULQ54102.1 fasciclin domain-containing protein [Flavihumibacter fluvii]